MQLGQTLYRSTFWRGLQYFSAFVLNLMIARNFGAADSGVLFYACSIYSLVILFVSLSLESGITYYAAKNLISVTKLLNFSTLWSLLTGILLILLFSRFLPDEGLLNMKPSLLFSSAVCFICGNLLSTFCTAVYNSKNDFVLPAVLSIVINIMLLIVLPYNGRSRFLDISQTNYLDLYFISFLIYGVALLIVAKWRYPGTLPGILIKAGEFRGLFRYSAMAFLGNIIFFLLYRIDYWFVERYCTPGQLGNYIQVSKLGQLFFVLPTILAAVIFPLTAGGQRAGINRILPLVARSILTLYIAACSILSLCGYWLFPFVFGKSFSGMYQPFLLLIPGILSLSGLFIVTAYYAGKNQIMVNIKGSLWALVVIVTADRIFIPRYGINAAALVSSAGYIIYQLYVLTVFKKQYGASISDFFIFRLSDWQELKNNLTRSTNSRDENQQ